MYDKNHLDMDNEDVWGYTPWERFKRGLIPLVYMAIAAVAFIAMHYFNQ
jgi:hypothetical protein